MKTQKLTYKKVETRSSYSKAPSGESRKGYKMQRVPDPEYNKNIGFWASLDLRLRPRFENDLKRKLSDSEFEAIKMTIAILFAGTVFIAISAVIFSINLLT